MREPSTRWYGLGTPYRSYYGRMIKRLGQLIKGDKKKRDSKEEEDRDLHNMERRGLFSKEAHIEDERSQNQPQSRYQSERDMIEVKGRKS